MEEYTTYQITPEEWELFKSNPSFLSNESYEKFNRWYASRHGFCSCNKTDINIIKDYFIHP